MENQHVNENTIFECFAAAGLASTKGDSAESFVDVEEYENEVMYPSFAKWADKAGYPEISKLFLRVAGEERLHAKWLRELYKGMGKPKGGKDTMRAKDALQKINGNLEALSKTNPDGLIEKALRVAYRVEMRESTQFYPAFRDQALAEGDEESAKVYQRVIDSETQHARWFDSALKEFQAARA